jgi:hypothetical protein
MLVDANILLFAVDERSAFHESSRAWLMQALNGTRRVGFPWATLLAFARIATNPRASAVPLSPSSAWQHVTEWLEPEVAWIPSPTVGHAEVVGSLITKYELRANLIADAHIAALAIEHGLTIVSADTDFARFTEIGWENPLAGEN